MLCYNLLDYGKAQVAKSVDALASGASALQKGMGVRVSPWAQKFERTWRKWYTRSLEEAVPQGVEVQVLSSAPNNKKRDD